MAGWQRPRPVPPAGVCRLRELRADWRRWRWPLFLSGVLHLLLLFDADEAPGWGRSSAGASAIRLQASLAIPQALPPGMARPAATGLTRDPTRAAEPALPGSAGDAAAADDDDYPLIAEGDASAEFRLVLAAISGELIARGVVRPPPPVSAGLDLEIRLAADSPPVIRLLDGAAPANLAEWGVQLTRLALAQAALPPQWAAGRRLRYRLEAGSD